MRLCGSRITIREMKGADLDAMLKWRPFSDPLYQPFGFPRQSKSDHLRWFDYRSRDPSRKLFVVENEEQAVIASLTLRDIQGKRSARLGITIGADYVSQGYGTEAMIVFLDHFFGEMGFARMVLDVAATNLRAVRTYEALGFRHITTSFKPAGHPSFRILMQEPRYRHLRHYFRTRAGFRQVLFYDMALSNEEWWAMRDAKTTVNPSCSDRSAPDPGRR